VAQSSASAELSTVRNGRSPSVEEDLRRASDFAKQGRLIDAEVEYRTILRLSPENAEGLNRLGELVLVRGDAEAAAALFQTAVAANPLSVAAHRNFGNAFASLERYPESLDHYHKALAIDPKDDATLGRLGDVLRILGRFDEAATAFESAIAIAPGKTGYYLNLGVTRQTTPDDGFLTAVEKHAQSAGQLGPEQQIALNFLLGKLYADLGLMQKSFDHQRVGNALKRQRIVYDEGNALRSFQRIRSFFTPELIESAGGHGYPSDLPVFILGVPRSGTTLVEQILASHPEVFGAGEIVKPMPAIDYGASWAGPASESPAAPQVSAEFLQESGFQIVERLEALAPHATRITDKGMGNFKFAGIFHLALPNARMIHVVRDPVDTCLSCFSIIFAEGWQNQSYELGELGRFYHAYEQLMEHWRRVLPAAAMLEVRYEDLVADLEGQARRMIDYCGLEWNAACLQFHKTARPVRTASTVQVRQPIYRTSVGRWRPQEEVLRPLLAGLKGEFA
jgi:tetratricopeptide (TPR) repeat protein